MAKRNGVVQFRAPPEMIAWLEAEARQRLTSVSAVVREHLLRMKRLQETPPRPVITDERRVELLAELHEGPPWPSYFYPVPPADLDGVSFDGLHTGIDDDGAE